MEEQEEKKGCVYFFRHIGLTPVKIGYSKHASPIGRFSQFKTYAPYGSEILGFIQTDKAKELETFLHTKFSSFRLDGEWFEINEEQVVNEVEFHSNKEDIKERNEFQIAWAKTLIDKSSFIKLEYEKERNIPLSSKNMFLNFKRRYLLDEKINRTHVSVELGVSRRTITIWIKKIKKEINVR